MARRRGLARRLVAAALAVGLSATALGQCAAGSGVHLLRHGKAFAGEGGLDALEVDDIDQPCVSRNNLARSNLDEVALAQPGGFDIYVHA